MSETSSKGSRLTEEVYKHLTVAIDERHLAPGQRLHERALARELGISRTPVREALQLLVYQGLATFRSGKIVVSELTVRDVQDIYEIARVLESLACSLAGARGTDEQMARLEEIMVEMESAAACKDLSRWKVADTRLHEHISQMAGNPVLFKIERQVSSLIRRIRQLALHQPGRVEQSTVEHRRLVEAIKARDEKLAGQMMSAHLATAERLVVEVLENYVVPFKGPRF